ncbi:unnamed protein product [Calypogeia fissa]
MGATLASLPSAVWAHLLSGGESSSSSNGGGVDLSAQQHHLQSLASSDAFHQFGTGTGGSGSCSSNPPGGHPQIAHPHQHHHNHNYWDSAQTLDMDYSSAAAASAHHFMMGPPPVPNSHSLGLSPRGSNLHGHGQWTSSPGDHHLQSSNTLMHQHQQFQQQCHQQQQQQVQQHCSDFQEQAAAFVPHPHMVSKAHVTHLHESPEDGREAKRSAAAAAGAGAPNQGNGPEEMSSSDSYKRPRLEQAAAAAPFKTQVRKEKLGERITALQQLVSPFGKTDTASVLQEAIGYIKFLQDQVQVLSTPYMKPTMNSGSLSHHDSQDLGSISSWASSNMKNTEDLRQDLRSRGLCLVPVSCTLQVANDNGADFWTPAIGGGCR